MSGSERPAVFLRPPNQTSQATIPRELPVAAKRVVDFCWKWWVPLFTTTFGLRNFWNVKKLERYAKGPGDRWRHLSSIGLVLAAHGALAWALALHEGLEALRDDQRRWVTAGLATGLGLLGKYGMALIGPVFLWAILWADPKALRTPRAHPVSYKHLSPPTSELV